jgi:hypothetical protein
MANGAFGTTPRSRRRKIRERAERDSLARILQLPRGSSWRDIAATELAEEEHQRFMDDSAWFYEQDERNAERQEYERYLNYESRPQYSAPEDEAWFYEPEPYSDEDIDFHMLPN